MNVTPLSIPDVKILEPERIGDQRGFVSETYNRRTLASRGIELEFVQDNHSLSRPKGTVRGLHYQSPPFAQDKLIRVISGSILDVAVDLRQGSPTYGKHVAALIGAKAWNQILIPIGFAHGFCTLEADTEIIYKVTNYYSPEHDTGVFWNDPSWGLSGRSRTRRVSCRPKIGACLGSGTSFLPLLMRHQVEAPGRRTRRSR